MLLFSGKRLIGCFLTGGILTASPAIAQQRLAIGVTGGATRASLHHAGISEDGSTRRWGFEAGATGIWQPTNHLGLQAALLFVQQGETMDFRAIDADPGYSATNRVRLNYLRLPVCLAYTSGRNGQGLQLAAGPYAALLVGGNQKFTSTTSDGVTTTSTRSVIAASTYPQQSGSDLYTRRLDVGLQGGAGYRLRQFLVQVQYVVGLRDLRPAAAIGPNGIAYQHDSQAYSTRAWQASLTYLFPTRQ